MKRKSKITLILTLALIFVSLACSLATNNAPASEGQPAQVISGEVDTPINGIPRNFSFALPLFNAESAWNQRVIGTTPVPENDQQILVTYRVLRGDTSTLHPSWFPAHHLAVHGYQL